MGLAQICLDAELAPGEAAQTLSSLDFAAVPACIRCCDQSPEFIDNLGSAGGLVGAGVILLSIFHRLTCTHRFLKEKKKRREMQASAPARFS